MQSIDLFHHFHRYFSRKLFIPHSFVSPFHTSHNGFSYLASFALLSDRFFFSAYFKREFVNFAYLVGVSVPL